MRTTVDLPPAVHRRASEIAGAQHRSLSSVVAELAARGLAASGEPATISVDDVSGFPVIRIGRPISASEVDELIDEP